MTPRPDVVPARYVSDRVDVRVRCPPSRVADDSIVDGQPGRIQPLDVRNHSKPDHERVQREDAPVRQPNPGKPPVPVSYDLLDRHPAAEVNAGRPVPLSDLLSRGRPEDPRQRRGKHLKQRHGAAHLPCARRHLAADEAAAQDTETPSPLDESRDLGGVTVRAQRPHVPHIRRALPPPRPGTGSDDENVVPQSATGGKDHLARREVHAHRGAIEPEVEPQRLKFTRRAQDRRVRPRSLDDFLGQRWPVIRGNWLRAEESNRPVEALLPQRFTHAQPAETRTHHDD